MTDLEKLAGIQEDKPPKMDGDRKQKMFEVAKKLHKGFWLEAGYDEGKWLLIAVFKINGTVYDVVHDMDESTAAEHAELFKHAMHVALEDYNKKSTIITTMH